MSLNILYHHRTQGRGAERVHIMSIVQALQAMGHRVTVVSPPGVDPTSAASGGAPIDKSQVETSGLQSAWKWMSRNAPNWLFELAEIAYNVPAWWRLRKILASERFDLVYERYAFYLVAGARLAKAHSIPFVLEVNEVSGIDHRARKQSFQRTAAAFERHLFRYCSSIHTVSSHLKKRILLQGIVASRVHVVPNAFDVTRVMGRGRTPENVRRYGLQDKIVFGFVGWFDHWDRLDILIETLPKILLRHPNARILLIGDGPVASSLKDAAARLHVSDEVIFTGAVPREQVFDFISLLDIAVLPHSNDFGSPVVMFEFMGLQIPVVAPRLEPILDVHRDGETALLFDPLRVDQCAAAIERLIASPELRRKLADSSFAKLNAEHTWHRNAVHILESVGFDSDEQSDNRITAVSA